MVLLDIESKVFNKQELSVVCATKSMNYALKVTYFQ